MLLFLALFVLFSNGAVEFGTQVYINDGSCQNQPVAIVIVNFAGVLGNFSNTSNGVIFNTSNDGCFEVVEFPLSFKFGCDENGTFDYYAYSTGDCTGGRTGFLNAMNLSTGCIGMGSMSMSFACSVPTISSDYAHISVYNAGVGTCTTNNVMDKIVDVYCLLNFCLKMKDLPFNTSATSGSVMVNSVSGSNLVMTSYSDDYCQTYIEQDIWGGVGCVLDNDRRRGIGFTAGGGRRSGDGAVPVQFSGFGETKAPSTTKTGTPTGNAPNPFSKEEKSWGEKMNVLFVCIFIVLCLFV